MFLYIILPSLVEGCFPADPKGHYLAAWEKELLSWKTLQIHYSVIILVAITYSTNHVFVLGQKPVVSSLSPPMPGPLQTMWELHCSATLEASQYNVSAELDSLLGWSLVLVI